MQHRSLIRLVALADGEKVAVIGVLTKSDNAER
jgi:hypothetical protein